jgi:hydroxymethylpyrimidine/phosphomethylpyrimidine kinase
LFYKRFKKHLPLRTALTIASSDSGGGAGIEADLKTFAAHGVYGFCALSAVTAQNTLEVTGMEALSPRLLTGQLEAVFSDFRVDAVKIGLIGNAPNAEALLAFFKGLPGPIPIVLDPVMVSASGHNFLSDEATLALLALFPLATVITPNKFEAEKLSGIKIESAEDALSAARIILEKHRPKSVLLKGGHLDSPSSEDILMDEKGFRVFSSKRIISRSDHGTGCTLSSAIAANLALGRSLFEAAAEAKSYVSMAMEKGLPLGKGRGPLNHFGNFYDYERDSGEPTLAGDPPSPGDPRGSFDSDFPGRARPYHHGRSRARESSPLLLSYPFSLKLQKVKELSPLTLCITNFVTVTDCANALLAIGASPVMSLSEADAIALCALSKALVINIGTINQNTLAVMEKAAKLALDKKIPMVLDPVGAGATTVRKDASLKLIKEYKPAIIRGNASEILSLSGALEGPQKGVDSREVEDTDTLSRSAKALSLSTGSVVGVTGETDIVVLGDKEIRLEGGSILMTRITGTGCLLSSIVGAFAGADPEDLLGSAAAAMSFLKVAGERAARNLSRPEALGEFKRRIFDELSTLR